MAWTAPMTAVANTAFTAAQFNLHVRDNLNQTAPAKATTAGGIFVATAANAIVERVADGDTVATAEPTSTVASFGDLSTTGPSVTVTTGSKAFVFLGTQIENSTGGGGGQMGYAVSGASSISANAGKAIRATSSTAGHRYRMTYVQFEDGLTPGSNTFTSKYTTPTGGTATFSSRVLAVIPL